MLEPERSFDNRGQLDGPPGIGRTPKKRRKNLTRPDKRAVPFPDLVQRDFAAPGTEHKMGR
jgi:hypothetical protein